MGDWYSREGWKSPDTKDTAAGRFETPTDSGKSGTYSPAASLSLIFWNEMRMLDNFVTPPMFDGGNVVEILGNGKYKVKLVGKGSVVTAVSTSESGQALFPWQRGLVKSNILKGALVLLLVAGAKTSSPVANVQLTYTIISVRQSGIFAPSQAEEYPV